MEETEALKTTVMNGAQESKRSNWEGKICPYLSQATLQPRVPASPTGLITGTVERAPTGEGHASTCQGPACMKFMSIQAHDEKGQLVQTGDGMCSDVAFPMAMNMLTNTISQFSANYRVKPKS